MAVDKLVDSAQLDADLTSVANAIRTKGGTSAQMAFPAGMVAAIQAIPTGGGASNIVTGTFKGTTSGTAFDISLPYTGSGFPIAVIVYPTDSNFNDLIHRYVLGAYCIIKKDPSLTPSYSSDSTYDLADVLYTYKSSVSNATVYTVAGNLAHNGPYKNGDANYNNGRRLEIRSPTKMSVYIAGSSTYGFAADIKYTYHVIYSS